MTLTSDAGCTRIVLERGRTVPFEKLPPRSVALDGYVQGPAIDAEQERYSFDHHAGCIRHATLSTCEMTLDALRVGLDPTLLTAYLNDLDPDSVLALWLLTRPRAAQDARVVTAVRSAGRLDALGPASGAELVPALRWALEPLPDSAQPSDDSAWRVLLDRSLERLNQWFAQGAPAEHGAMRPHASVGTPAVEWLHRGDGWALVRSNAGLGAFRVVYANGFLAAVVAQPLPGTTRYSVGKASEFVKGFNVPRILKALAAAELQKNPAQSPAHNWGGGSTIGGSPRNPDGSSSRLDWEAVAQLTETNRT